MLPGIGLIRARWFPLLALLFPLTAAQTQVTQEWVARHAGPGTGEDRGFSVTVDGAGNVYVTGQQGGGANGLDLATFKYDSSGNAVWARLYDGPAHGDDVGAAIAVDASGNVYVTGFSFGLPTAEQDFVTIKYDADGNQQWVSRYNGPADNWDEAFKISLDASGNVYVSGRSNHSAIWFDFDFLTIKYDNDGQELWAARFNGTGNDWDQANDFVVDADGNVYVTGHAAKQLGTAYHDCTTIKYNSAGVQQWVRLFDGAGQNWDEGVGIVLDGLGHVIVAGFQSGSGTVYDYITLQYDLNGNLQWNRTYNSGISFSADVLRDLEVDASGNIYVTGPSVLDYATVKYDPAGNEQWVRRFGGAADDVPFSLDISAIGDIYVTGASAGNYVTLKYDPAGALQWNHVYDGPAAGNAPDTSQCVVVDSFETSTSPVSVPEAAPARTSRPSSSSSRQPLVSSRSCSDPTISWDRTIQTRSSTRRQSRFRFRRAKRVR
jgi:hypothetical protein